MDDVEKVESELGLSEFEDQLRAVTGFWKQLQAQRSSARKDKRFLPRYRRLLEQGITQVRARAERDAAMSEADLESACKEYWRFYEETRRRCGVAEHEARRFPPYLEEWAAKWLPEKFKATSEAMTRFIDHPSKGNLECLKRTTAEMVEAFAAGK